MKMLYQWYDVFFSFFFSSRYLTYLPSTLYRNISKGWRGYGIEEKILKLEHNIDLDSNIKPEYICWRWLFAYKFEPSFNSRIKKNKMRIYNKIQNIMDK